ncbi:hypothetical protein GCM10028822_34680 [Hymenobacter terrigena]
MTVFKSYHELEEFIRQVAVRKVEKFQSYHNYMVVEQRKNEFRLISPPEKQIHTPSEWNESKLFNPFYVLKHSKYLAKTIYKRLKDNTYIPHEPFVRGVPKGNGKIRLVSSYEIPDDAVSKKVFSQLLSKNKHRFSGFSYAYRDDRNAHFAIQDISYDLKKYPRMFVAEFDFSDFFNSINHDFLFQQLEKNSLAISKSELLIIKAFLHTRKGRGFAQGTSISLFLANAACGELDSSLERLGVRFARYADDTLIWSDSYEKICNAFNVMHDFSMASGVAINAKKSHGISLLSTNAYTAEIAKKKMAVDFLGYKISHNFISIKDSSVISIKSQIAHLLFKNLIEPLKTKPQNAKCNPSNDDEGAFASSIHQIRRFVYGDLTEFALANYIKGNFKKLTFKGVMSYYPLVTDDEQLKCLDKWFVSTILNVLRLRNKILTPTYGSQVTRFPYNLNSASLISVCRIRRRIIDGKPIKAFEIPSFLRINHAIRIGIENEGVLAVVDSASKAYDY